MKLSSIMHRVIVQRELRALSRSSSIRLAQASERTSRFVITVLCSIAVAGCSIAMPVGDMFSGNDKLVTQSVADDEGQKLSSELTPDDWSFASMALGTALDPLGSGETAPWANPRTGIRGDFVALGKPFLKNDLVCRKFNATLNYQGQSDKLTGSACRLADGQWTALDASHI